MQSNTLLYCALMLSSATATILIFKGYFGFATKVKLRKHTEEWERRKAECIKNIDPIVFSFHPNVAHSKVMDEYHDYITELMQTESKTVIGCCFPPIGKIERRQNED